MDRLAPLFLSGHDVSFFLTFFWHLAMRIYRVDGVCAHKGQAGFGYRQLTAAAAFLVCGWTWLAGAGRVGLEAGGPAGTRRSGRFLLAYISETHLPLGLFLGLSGYTSLDMPPVLHPGFDSASAVDTRRTPREEGGGWFILSTGSCPRGLLGRFLSIPGSVISHTRARFLGCARQGWKRGGLGWDGHGWTSGW